MTSHRTYHVDGVAIIVVAEVATMMAAAAKTMKRGDDILLAEIITIIVDEDVMVNPQTESRITTSTSQSDQRRKRKGTAEACITDLVLVITRIGDKYVIME
jgi:hypothetical protein